MATSADQLHAEVEARLRRIVAGGLAAPCNVVRTLQRTVSEAMTFARTVFNVTTDGFFGWDVDAGVPRLGSARARRTVPATDATAPDAGEGRDRQTAHSAVKPGTGAADLAIAGYEDLAASHIVARLGRLDDAELAKIREFEVANRGRRTVVGKIDQLLARR
jgi:hypothetical protein